MKRYKGEIILLLTIYKSINSKSEDENYKSNLLTKESIFLKEIIEKFSPVKVNDERISYLFKIIYNFREFFSSFYCYMFKWFKFER